MNSHFYVILCFQLFNSTNVICSNIESFLHPVVKQMNLIIPCLLLSVTMSCNQFQKLFVHCLHPMCNVFMIHRIYVHFEESKHLLIHLMLEYMPLDVTALQPRIYQLIGGFASNINRALSKGDISFLIMKVQ